ncbi:GNAT family N-acetyltransferase [Bacillus sp. FJAT-50079]|uniref:GNAT family N-acetyltransferase n=1 Tax=Bacillus sp. FJAT-50079 TaxID=2833577 RepID=UPI001BC93A82|nr:GNAT family N-acetyltransferase [Bacillus sp. FJAT-50079]MBS4209376.1 GNAT family N-acetyltransferase [Bacillus sp. FJAT-50079]
MRNLKIISDYLHNEELRKSFNQLSQDIFKLNMEPWYQAGFFKNRYIPFSYLYEGKIIANASISFIDVIINHELKKAIQIGTVMTDKKFRKQGLAKRLMNQIIDEYEEKVDFIYLFANDSVLSFYPRFGFKKVLEQHYTMDASHIFGQEAMIRKLDPEDRQDQTIMIRLMENRKPISKTLGIVNDQWPLSVSLLDRYCDFLDRYYLVEDDMIVLADRNDGILDIYDVISQNDIHLDDIIEKMLSPQDRRVEFHFIPELKKYTAKKSIANWEDDTLFVRSKHPFYDEVLFPLTSHT